MSLGKLVKNFTVFSFTFSLFLQPILANDNQTQYPIYEGKSSDLENFEDKTKIGKSYTNLSNQSGSVIKDTVFENQKMLRDEIYDAMGKYRISSTIIDEQFDVKGNEYTFFLKPMLQPQRIVRILNNYKKSKDEPKTQYMVSDAVSLRNTLGVSTELNGVTTFDVMRAETAMSIQKISFVSSLEDYNSIRPEKKLSRYIDDSESFDDYVQSQEKEQSRIFFKGFFDPYRIAKKFVKVTSDKIVSDKSLRTGDILLKRMIRRTGSGVTLSKALVDLGYHVYTYQELAIGLKREENNKFLLKIQIEEGYRHDTGLVAGLPVIEFKPQRTSFDRTTYVIAEKLYRLDLNDSEARSQLDSILNSYGKQLTPASYYEDLISQMKPISGSVDELFEKTRSTLSPQYIFRNKTETGLFGVRTLKSRSTELSQLQPTNAEKSEHVLGEVQRFNSSRLRLFFLESNEDTKRKFRILTSKSPSGELQTDLGFEYAFDDSRTNEHEYKNYLNFLNDALFLDKTTSGSQAEKLKDLLNERLSKKTSDKDQQAASAALYFSQKFVKRILSQDKESVAQLITDIYLGKNKTWNDLKNLSSKVRVAGGDCRSVVNPEYATMMWGPGKISCTKVTASANRILNTFTIATKEKYHDVTESFVNLVNNQDMKPILPMLMLQIGLLSKFDKDGSPIYISLDDAFKNGDVEMNLSFVGDGVDGIIYEQIGDVATLSPVEYEGDFELITPVATSPLIIKSELATDGEKIYLQFDSYAQAQSSYVLKGIASKYKMILNDKPLALVRVNNLTSKDIAGKANTAPFFRYLIELPMIDELSQGDNSLQFWIEDGSGGRVTEPFTVKFKI